MILWRISNHESLDGAGGLYAAGRWHTKGHPVLYCALNPATALLETLVHMEIDAEDLPGCFRVLKIEGPDSLTAETADSLPEDWAVAMAATQAVGDRWLEEKRSLLLRVPSVLVPETWNVLVNPRHNEMGLLRVTRTYNHPFDARLL